MPEEEPVRRGSGIPGGRFGIVARLTRHELKTDELAARLATAKQFFAHRRKTITAGAGTALLLLGASLGIFLYVRSRQAKAAEAFSLALAGYHGFVTPNPPPTLTVPHFKTAEEKYKEGLQKFSDVSSQFRWYRQGRWARYYAALCQRELGKNAEAEKELAAIAKEGDPDLAALSKMALAALYQQTSRGGEAEKIYRELESHPTLMVPKPAVQIALAELYHKTNPPQATALYKQIEKEYSGTAAGDQASKMLRSSAN